MEFRTQEAWEALLGAANAARLETLPPPTFVVATPPSVVVRHPSSLQPLTPLGPLRYDRSENLVMGEKNLFYHQLALNTPIYMSRGLTIAEEKAYYMRFRINTSHAAIRFLHAYYEACGILKLEDRLVRFNMLYQLRI